METEYLLIFIIGIFGVEDDPVRNSKTLDMAMLNKIDLSWNIGLGNMVGDIMTFPRLMGSIKALFPASYRVPFISPDRNRDIDVMARGKRTYSRNTVRFHRDQIAAILEGLENLDIAVKGHVSVSRYKKEMSDAKIVVSPFGWGEIGVRDFESFLYGAALVKPDMSHMETWPDIFKPGETYQPIRWDFKDLETTIGELLADSKRRIDLAQAGQEAYRKMISTQGMQAFCDWFIQQISL